MGLKAQRIKLAGKTPVAESLRALFRNAEIKIEELTNPLPASFLPASAPGLRTGTPTFQYNGICVPRL